MFLTLVTAKAQNFAYVTNSSSNSVSVIDTSTNTVVATVAVGSNPVGVAITPDGTRAYVANQLSNSVSVIDTSSNTVVATVAVGSNPVGVAITPDGTRAYVANAFSNSVSVIDTPTNNVVATVAVGRVPNFVAITPDGTRAYVTDFYDYGFVSVIDTSDNTVIATVAVGGFPTGVAITPDGTRAYVATAGGSGSVWVIDTSSNTVVTTVAVGTQPTGVAITPDGTRAYVANRFSNSVSVIDTSTNTVLTTVPVLENAFGMAITPDGTRAYVTIFVFSSVQAIDTSTNTVVATIAVGSYPAWVAITPAHGNQPLSFSPSSLTFGSQGLGTTSGPQTESATNTGTTNLSIMTVTVGGTNASDFATNANTCTGTTLTPNGACTVSVTFTPSATGSRSASLIFTDDASNSPQTVTLTGAGTAPVAGVSPPSLTFGNQNLGTTSGSQPVTLSNKGSAALTITSIATNANFGETNTCAGSVAAGGSCTINMTFSPTATGPLTGTLTITDNSNGVAGSTETVSLSGTGLNPGAGLSSTLLTVYQAENTTSTARKIMLTSTGTTNLNISSITITGPNASDFAETNNCPASMAPRAYCILNLTFTPTILGAESADLTITDNPTNSPQTVALSGIGLLPVMLFPTSLNFGNQAENTTSPPQVVNLANTQSAALAVSSITPSGDFAQTNTCGSSVPAGSTCTLSVTFTPGIIGVETGTLTLTDTASGSPQIVSLSGRGVMQATLSAASLWFTGQGVGTTSPPTNVLLTNNLSTALPISITFTGADPGDFAQTNTCNGSVAARSTCTISVTFTPTATGLRTATMYVNDSANNSPQTLALTGTGQ